MQKRAIVLFLLTLYTVLVFAFQWRKAVRKGSWPSPQRVKRAPKNVCEGPLKLSQWSCRKEFFCRTNLKAAKCQLSFSSRSPLQYFSTQLRLPRPLAKNGSSFFSFHWRKNMKFRSLSKDEDAHTFNPSKWISFGGRRRRYELCSESIGS